MQLLLPLWRSMFSRFESDVSCGKSKSCRAERVKANVMFQRCLSILLLVILAVLPAAGEASALATAGHCAPAVHAMVMTHSAEHPAVEQGCGHGAARRQLPCAMAGSCNMPGCMALPGILVPQVMSAVQHLAFRLPAALRLEGLALAPPVEPPRG